MKNWKSWLLPTAVAMIMGIHSTGICLAEDAKEDMLHAVEPKVVVTAKSNKPIEDTVGSVVVITAEDIARSNASSVKDVLVESAGITLGVNSSSISGRQSISIRGSASDHVLILIDGKKVSGTDAQIGHSDFQYNWVPMDAIERIEVIKGPASSIYGSEAIGGVVNIITKKADQKFHGNIDVKYGASSDEGGDQIGGSVNLSVPITSKLSMVLGAERVDLEAAEDEDDPTVTKIEGKEYTNVLARVQYDFDDTQHVEVSGSFGEEDRYRVEDELYYDIERASYGLGYGKRFGLVNFDIDGYVVDSDSHYNTTRSSGGYTHNLTTSVARAELGIASFKNHFIATGIEYKNEEYDKVYDLAASAGNNFKNDLTNIAGFIQDEIEIGSALIVTLGARYDDHEKFGGELSPKINILTKLGENHRIKAGYGEGFKAPTVTQNSSSYVSTSRHIFRGNDDLQPETSQSYEVGYEYFGSSTTIKTAAFYTEVEDLISSIRTADNTPPVPDEYLYINVDQANYMGFEFEITQYFTDSTSLKLGYTYLDTENEETGDPLRLRPDHSVNLRFTTRLPFGIETSIGVNYTGEQTNGADESDPDYEEYDSFTVVNLQLSRSFGEHFTARVGVDNVADEDLDDMPYDIKGRLFYVGLNYGF